MTTPENREKEILRRYTNVVNTIDEQGIYEEGAQQMVFGSYLGSYAYGTENEDSDLDVRAVHVSSVENLLGLNPDVSTKKSNQVDFVSYELSKFMKLAIAGNFSVMEFLFSPVMDIDLCFLPLWKQKNIFITQNIKDSAIGIANNSLRDLRNGRDRYEKMTFHAVRILLQTKNALKYGHFVVSADTNLIQDYLPDDKEKRYHRIEQLVTEVHNMPSDIPENPDLELCEQLLLDVRAGSKILFDERAEEWLPS